MNIVIFYLYIALIPVVLFLCKKLGIEEEFIESDDILQYVNRKND